MIKRIISAILVVALGLSLNFISGCGKKDDTTNNSSPDMTQSSSESQMGFDVDTNGNTATSSEVYKNVISGVTDLTNINNNKDYTGRVTDLKGKTVKIQSWGTGSTAIYGTGIIAQRANNLISSIEKTLNCKIEIITEISDQATASALASGKPPADIIYLSKNNLLTQYRYNRLVALDELKVFDFSDRSSFTNATELAKFNGKYYAIAPRTYGTVSFMTGTVIFANIDVLKKSGVTVSDLTKWVSNKEWTWDKMREVAEKVKAAGYTFLNDGNTLADNEREHSLYQALVNSNGVDWLAQEDDKLVFCGDQQKQIAALDFYKEMYNNGYVKQVDSAVNKFSEGKTAMLSAAMYTAKHNERSVSWGNYTILPVPIGPDANDYTYASGDYSFAGIAKGTKPSGLNDAEIATVLNLMNTCLINESENNSLVVSESIAWAKDSLAQQTVKMYSNLNAENKFNVTWSGLVTARTKGNNNWIELVFDFALGNLSKQQILAQKSSIKANLETFFDQ